jgi:alcohol dehydrogenase (cytochrome c)
MAPTNNPAERRRIVFLVPLSGYALDDKTLKVLWSFNTGSLNSAPPMTYSVDGKQYVAVLIGANVVAQGMLAKAPEDKDIQNTSMLFVFSL